MYSFKKLTPVNGFDFEDLNNARQNNYSWSMTDLDDYIYVGTGRNIVLGTLKQLSPYLSPSILISPEYIDSLCEIWRYKRNGKLPWKRVYKSDENTNLKGIRFMLTHKPFQGRSYLYASAFGSKVTILKSSNGCDWFPLTDNVLEGTSSRAMLSHNGKLYVATTFDSISDTFGNRTLLYSSIDPEHYPWHLVTNYNDNEYIDSLNPKGAITNMAVFNNRLYVATSNPDGVQVWRCNHIEPKLNDWTLVVDKGFGDSSNVSCLSIGVFKNHLYVSGAKSLPLAWALPIGCDIIRISKNDNWKLIVGGYPLKPSTPSTGSRNIALSGLNSGFNNPFNVYAWQIQQYRDSLIISTFDDSSNMEVILDFLIGNRNEIKELIGGKNTKLLITIYKSIVKTLNKINYPFGFDLYESNDGINFKPIFLNGFKNPDNYGGRMLLVDSDNKLYIGTANPFNGCEVWSTSSNPSNNIYPFLENHYNLLDPIREKLAENYNLLEQVLPPILELLVKKNLK